MIRRLSASCPSRWWPPSPPPRPMPPTAPSGRPASVSPRRTSRRSPDFQRHVLPVMGRVGCKHPVLPRLVPGAGAASASPSSATTSRCRPRDAPHERGDRSRINTRGRRGQSKVISEADPRHPPQGRQAARRGLPGSIGCSSTGSTPAPRASSTPRSSSGSKSPRPRSVFDKRAGREDAPSRSSPTGPTAGPGRRDLHHPVPDQRRVDRRGRRGRRHHRRSARATPTSSPSTTTA